MANNIIATDSHISAKLGTISDETLLKCFEMPSAGVEVVHPYFTARYYPITAVDKIGHFCTDNGIVVFVHSNGKTYVTKMDGILDELRAAGYTESSMPVPFSKGGQIQDPSLSALWESINK